MFKTSLWVVFAFIPDSVVVNYIYIYIKNGQAGRLITGGYYVRV